MDATATHAPISSGRRIAAWLAALVPLIALMGVATMSAASTDIPMADIQQRLIYRTFFFHVPTAITSHFLMVGLLVASLLFLWTKREIFDRLNQAFTELAFVGYSFVLVSGMLWGKSAWGHYWSWEPRLTSAAVLWFLVVAALLLRSAIDDPGRRMRFAAIFGIILFADVPLVHFATAWFAEGLHPGRNAAASNAGYAAVRPTMMLCWAAILYLFAVLAVARTQIEGLRRRAADLARPLNLATPEN